MSQRIKLMEQVKSKLFELEGIVASWICISLGMPKIKYRLRGEAAGRWNSLTQVIDFNPLLLEMNPVEFIRNTVPHEYAHYVVTWVYGDVAFRHGQEWQQIMKLFKAPPHITHQYDVSSIEPVFVWSCSCMEHQLPRKVHKQLLDGTEFDCNSCGHEVKTFIR